LNLLLFNGITSMTPNDDDPQFIVKALLEFGDRTREGDLVRAVAIPWYEILATIARDRDAAYQIDSRKWEEIIARAWERDGYSVILTPRSGDRGRDVIATKDGVGSVRIFDQVKAYRPGHIVNADEVRAMIGVITGAQNVSKLSVSALGVLVCSANFAR
jgi:restriction system protein